MHLKVSARWGNERVIKILISLSLSQVITYNSSFLIFAYSLALQFRKLLQRTETYNNYHVVTSSVYANGSLDMI